MHVDIASLTSKGQFTIPHHFRDTLNLRAGSKMVVMCDGKHLLLKPIKRGSLAGFRQLIEEADKLDAKAQRVSSKTRKGGSK